MKKRCILCHRSSNIFLFLKDDLSIDGSGNECLPCRRKLGKISYTNKLTPLGKPLVETPKLKLGKIRASAKRRGLECTLSISDINDLLFSGLPCGYCGLNFPDSRKLNYSVQSYNGNNKDIIKFKRYTGARMHLKSPVFTVDRINNSVGYINENVIQCCFLCNNIKGSLFTIDEIKLIIPEKISDLLKIIKETP